MHRSKQKGQYQWKKTTTKKKTVKTILNFVGGLQGFKSRILLILPKFHFWQYITCLCYFQQNNVQGCHNPGNSWKFEILLETPGKTIFFPVFPGILLENHQVTRFCEFCEVTVVLMRKKAVLPRVMSRMGSLITFKHCHSLVNLISVWNRFSDKIKHCLEWFLW